MSSKRYDFLRNQFAKIDNETFDKIINCDPTQEKKYSGWLLKIYSKSNLQISELEIAKNAILTYDSIKSNLPEILRDINKFDSFSNFLFTLNSWLVQRFNENEKNVNHLKSGGDVIFENEEIFIVKLLSYEGSLKYGSNTSWCTLKSHTYSDYKERGFLYIVIPKTDKYKKYFGNKSQLHFEKNEFRNDTNKEVDLVKIIIKNPELFQPFKKIDSIKKSSIQPLFFLSEHEPEVIADFIKSYGFEVLNFVEKFSINFIDNLFRQFGEKVFAHIPDSNNKIISFVCNVEAGLKKLLIKSEVDITNEVFEKSVSVFPSNILLMNCDNEKVWESAIIKETWLVNRSPFLKEPDKLMKIIPHNFLILKHFAPIKIFSLEQRKEIAKKIVDDNCDNYLDLLKKLGEFDEGFQVELVKKTPSCVAFLNNPCEKALKTSESIIKKEEEKRKKLIEENNRKEKERRRKEKESEDRELYYDQYNKYGIWNFGKDIRLEEVNGETWYVSPGGYRFKTMLELRTFIDKMEEYEHKNKKYSRKKWQEQDSDGNIYEIDRDWDDFNYFVKCDQ